MLDKYYELIENDLRTLFTDLEKDNCKNVLTEAMSYSVFSGGKRLRPILMMMTAEDIGVDAERILPFASSLELIHTYSLIHDDLPCMDNDDFRRGQETCHKKYGETVAVLAGDALLNYACENVLKRMRDLGDKDIALNSYALGELFACSGIGGMIGGQFTDIFEIDENADRDLFDFCFRNKTAKLISAAFTIPAILSGYGENSVDEFRKLGTIFGMAYQYKDNLSDYGNDRASSDKFFTVKFSEAECRTRMLELSKAAEEILLKLFSSDSPIADFMKFLLCGKKI